ncbi:MULTISPECIES: AAA family ATPase [unclassified Frigoribacterium]|uniref:AAA family ATPase n=1 Tax=unclassified Frigoribacterium TaxID=2627005 RepID=UPI0015638D08|nr:MULTISPECIES: AAA family ATPase [unclassified Frigoribacterium]NQW87128.1 AAA family ATPase [Frigoribacterium sp. VKM Ac-2860]NQX08459.1 AAA family ATPase [Frigoribacterium sp. VKM Ac-2859]
MNLHRLTLRAIGPYAGEHSIDFAALGASGTFLLEGPTGSGKSTIIDAIVFALYGGLAGSASTPDRLRSHHAAPDVEPFVELVFENGAGVHRIRRTPAYRRPKARGTGTTPANATAKLWRLSSPDAVDGEIVSISTQEAGAEVSRILGLTRQQFVQTVVLPQGEFAAFLRSTGEKRKEVLQSLFGTEIYERTTAELVDRRKVANAAVAAADRDIELARARLLEASGLEAEALDEGLAADGGAALLGDLEAQAVAASAQRSRVVEARDAARRSLDGVRALGAALDRRADLTVRRTRLDEGDGEIATVRSRVAAATRAATVTDALAAVTRATEAERDAASRLAEAAGAAEAAGVAGVVADGETIAADGEIPLRADVAARRDARLSELALLTEAARTEKALPGRRTALEAAERSLVDADERRRELDAHLVAAPAVRASLVVERDALADASTDLVAAEQATAEARLRLRDLDDLDALGRAVDAASARLADDSAAALRALDDEAGLRRRQIEGMAGHLAAGLVVGDPCPVCGSREHPAPAAPGTEHPTDDQVEAASRTSRAAEARQRESAARHATAEGRAAEARRALGDLTRDDVESDLARLALRVSEATRTRTALAASEAALVAHDREVDELRAERDDLRERAATVRERVAADRRALLDDEAEIARLLDGRAPTIAELTAAVGDGVERDTRLLTLLDAADVASDAAAVRRAELAAALERSGFDDVDQVADAALEAGDLTALEAQASAHERERAIVAAGLVEPEVAVLTGDEVADVPSAVEALDLVEAELDEVTDRATRTGDRAERARQALAALEAVTAAADAAVEHARAVVRMANLASASTGENVKGVTLGTYVLLRRFDEVVAAANVRLSVMSSGRYELASSDEREVGSRSRKTGLSLVIRDATTDTTRDPGSFSGGETFYASLSLALGLADVVQAEAGGLELGTLFVDEGFGSLDPETLDAVMSELGRLSASGRVIGIVSHVDELKQRIADRVEVRRRPDGSSVLRSTAG